jgi:tight adherence protein C
LDLIFGLVFGCVAALVFAAGSLAKKKPTKERLARLSTDHAGGVAVAVSADDSWNAAAGAMARLLGRASAWFVAEPKPEDGPLRRRLIEAGYRKPSAAVIYTSTRIVLSLAVPLSVLSFAPVWSMERLQLFTVLVAAVVAGRVFPSQWLDHKRAARQRQIILGLPDALDLMVVCVEAGLGIQASLARIGREFRRTNPILSSEFELVTLEARAGKSNTEALRSMAERSGVIEVSSLVAMLVQTERFGTSLADTLRIQADGLRVQRMLRAEEMAGKAPLKMMFPTLLIFAATLLITLGPGLLQLLGFFADR